MLDFFSKTLVDTDSLVKVMTAAIAPVTVISGLCFFLSIIATRYARCVDRVRELLNQLPQVGSSGRERTRLQIEILYERARALRTTMICASASVFFVSATIMAIFAGLLFRLHVEDVAAWLFILALLSLLVSIVLFIRDILISLKALKLEVLGQLPRTDLSGKPGQDL